MLVRHGGADPLVGEGADPATSRLHVWPDGPHTVYDHAAERNALTAGWFADHLLPG